MQHHRIVSPVFEFQLLECRTDYLDVIILLDYAEDENEDGIVWINAYQPMVATLINEDNVLAEIRRLYQNDSLLLCRNPTKRGVDAEDFLVVGIHTFPLRLVAEIVGNRSLKQLIL